MLAVKFCPVSLRPCKWIQIVMNGKNAWLREIHSQCKVKQKCLIQNDKEKKQLALLRPCHEDMMQTMMDKTTKNQTTEKVRWQL